MSVQFECSTDLDLPVRQAFDRARNIDAHVDSMSGSQKLILGRYMRRLIEQRNRYLAASTANC